MSNKSGISSQIISIPKGGGALPGIGEKFSPDLFTGTGNFTVPVALPPGRNGFQPQLNHKLYIITVSMIVVAGHIPGMAA